MPRVDTRSIRRKDEDQKDNSPRWWEQEETKASCKCGGQRDIKRSISCLQFIFHRSFQASAISYVHPRFISLTSRFQFPSSNHALRHKLEFSSGQCQTHPRCCPTIPIRQLGQHNGTNLFFLYSPSLPIAPEHISPTRPPSLVDLVSILVH